MAYMVLCEPWQQQQQQQQPICTVAISPRHHHWKQHLKERAGGMDRVLLQEKLSSWALLGPPANRLFLLLRICLLHLD